MIWRLKKKFTRLNAGWRIYIVVFLFLIFYNEYLVHTLQKFRWSNIYCKNPDKCVKILLVADPQILGNVNENVITQLDSDRHLSITYQKAIEHVQPDVIAFLGDLMDEGSTADESNFKEYYERFGKIFPTHETAKCMYVSGDNDIGGEGSEQVKPSKIRRFRQYFSEKPAWIVKNNVTFYNINRITHEMLKEDRRIIEYENDFVRVFLSHMTILRVPGSFTFEAIGILKPNVIFSAHLHGSYYIKSVRNKLRTSTLLPLNNDRKTAYKVNAFNLDYHLDTNEVVEIIVPTCSYRMGFYDIGYGFAVLDDESLRYTVLWTAGRFAQLISYLVYLFIPVIVKIWNCIMIVFRDFFGCCRRTYLPL